MRTYFSLDGHHVQFNVFDVATLRKAQEHPEEHGGLIVRVAGYSDYFVLITEDGCEVLTTAPKSVAEVEAAVRG